MWCPRSLGAAAAVLLICLIVLGDSRVIRHRRFNRHFIGRIRHEIPNENEELSALHLYPAGHHVRPFHQAHPIHPPLSSVYGQYPYSLWHHPHSVSPYTPHPYGPYHGALHGFAAGGHMPVHPLYHNPLYPVHANYPYHPMQPSYPYHPMQPSYPYPPMQPYYPYHPMVPSYAHIPVNASYYPMPMYHPYYHMTPNYPPYPMTPYPHYLMTPNYAPYAPVHPIHPPYAPIHPIPALHSPYAPYAPHALSPYWPPQHAHMWPLHPDFYQAWSQEGGCSWERPFPCWGSGTCIPISAMCDKHYDCGNYLDEDSRVCVSGKRPSVHLMQMFFSLPAQSWMQTKLFNNRDPYYEAVAFKFALTVADLTWALTLSEESVTNLKTMFDAAANEYKNNATDLGMDEKDWDITKYFFTTMTDTGFEAS